MLGDLREWLGELDEVGVPSHHVLCLTFWGLVGLIFDVLAITVHNLIVPERSQMPVTVAKPSSEPTDTSIDSLSDSVADDSSTI